MAALDMKPMQDFVEGLMVDKCVVSRDPQLTSDDTWSEATGTYAEVGRQILYQGKCSVSVPRRVTPQTTVQGLALDMEVNYFLILPVSVVVDFFPLDRVVITSSITKILVGQKFTVIDVVGLSTYSADRRLMMHRLIRTPQ